VITFVCSSPRQKEVRLKSSTAEAWDSLGAVVRDLEGFAIHETSPRIERIVSLKRSEWGGYLDTLACVDREEGRRRITDLQ
jgi:hypothetical protein